MLEADLAEVVSIEQATSPTPWRESQLRESLANHQCYVFDLNGQIAGFMIFTLVVDVAELLVIAVSPAQQGKGIGRALLQQLIASVEGSAEKLFLEVRVSNFRARRLYQEAGFEELCLRENYYRTENGKEDAVMMALSLKKH